MIPLNEDILPGLGSSVSLLFLSPSAGVTGGFSDSASPVDKLRAERGAGKAQLCPQEGLRWQEKPWGLFRAAAGSGPPGLGSAGAPRGLRPHGNDTQDAKPQRQESWGLHFHPVPAVVYVGRARQKVFIAR